MKRFTFVTGSVKACEEQLNDLEKVSRVTVLKMTSNRQDSVQAHTILIVQNFPGTLDEI